MSTARPADVASCRAAWPEVDWDDSHFLRHLGDDEPAYPDDLYVGGAAGHRLDAAWTCIERCISPRTLAAIRRRPNADLEAEDLWAEARLKLHQDDTAQGPLEDGRHPAKIIRYRARVRLWSYFTTVAVRIAVSRQRARHRPERAASNTDHASRPMPSTHADPELVRAFTDALTKLSAEQRAALALVYGAGVKQNRVAQTLGWSEAKASRQLAAAIDVIADALCDQLDGRDGHAAFAIRDMWARCWRAELGGEATT